MPRFLILMAFAILPSLIYGQSRKTFINQTITYSKLAEILQQEKWDTLYFEGVNFKNDFGRRPWQDSVFGEFTVVNAIKAGKVKALEFNDCSFSESIFFEGNFEGNVALVGCRGPEELVFENCNIDQLWISESKFQMMFFQHTRIKETLVRTENDERATISFFKSSFDGITEIIGSRISIVKCDFNLTEGSTIENDGTGNVWTTVRDSKFAQSDSGYLQVSQKSGYIQLVNNTFSGNVDLYGEGDVVTWNLVDNVFKNEVGFRSGADIGPASYISFKDIYNDRPLGWHIDNDDKPIFYDGHEDQISMERYYTNLLRLHKRFHDFYLDGGDIYSANILYVRIKDLETRHLAYQYETSPSFDLWMRISLNKLLKFYTRYGTDPSRAIVISLWVILAFGMFYVFFPSSWDLSSRSKMISDLRNFRSIEGSKFKRVRGIFVSAMVTILNALALSLNSFTTLGFGEIPTQGFARYVTIGEGFLGWFLLTLFSVALISQSSF